MSKLTENRYGKQKVRVLKVLRNGKQHSVCELETDVLLEGDLEGSYLSEDNSSIVPTDTIKNTIHVLAHDHLGPCRTAFVSVIGEHFLSHYPHLTDVLIETRERTWKPMEPHGVPHPHSFEADLNGTRFSRGTFRRDTDSILSAGIRDHLIMKTTGSGFENYNVCDLTTLPPTNERIFATRMTVEWYFNFPPDESHDVESRVMEAACSVFSGPYSPSVQRTLYQMGEAALKAVDEIERIELRLPNVHFLDIDLSNLGRPDQKEVFLPTDEPHGEIQATVCR